MEKRAKYGDIKIPESDHTIQNYAWKLLPDELTNHSERVLYLPIFSVNNRHKPCKVRFVWDTDAKVDWIALNSMLINGPDQLVILPKVVSVYRESLREVCGDINEIFQQVRIRKEAQQSQKILWKNAETGEIEEFAMNVVTFSASFSPSSAQFFKNKSAEKVWWLTSVDVFKFNYLTDKFWKKWIVKYLPTQKRRTKCFDPVMSMSHRPNDA